MTKTVVNSQFIDCGSHKLDYSTKTLIMGILNVTPDSFSDGGSFNHIDKAIEHAKQMVIDGADLIDIGGESTRPGSDKVSVEEELERTIPVIKELSRTLDVPISIDTYKSEVAKQAIEAGAHIINDVWGAKADPEMAKVAADYNVPIILMHNRDNKNYQNLIPDMIADLYESIKIVKSAGVKDKNIILDPGIGFAKTVEQNIEAIQNVDKFKALGYPVLLATSRKSTIGHVLNLPPKERIEGTAATIGMGISKGIHMTRVHDVKEIARFTKMMDVLVGKGVIENG
ncbi:dihydropteroate synthase [Priestia flexa]|uniref:dihydropteroate synthase n=1 Tax=Priestia flexa TaxID=86664 RepID=UPI002E244AC0|nr:dihydropteroate synthase [Priestia flexa]MED3824637.1 dihydropteroate synthase [Priestia flexa]